jgi:hypothetical protein
LCLQCIFYNVLSATPAAPAFTPATYLSPKQVTCPTPVNSIAQSGVCVSLHCLGCDQTVYPYFGFLGTVISIGSGLAIS